MKIFNINDLKIFFKFIETDTELFKIDILGYPWYWVVRETIINNLCKQTVFENQSTNYQIRSQDFDKKKDLLDQEYDYLFLMKAKMRRTNPNEYENILIIDLVEYLEKNNKSFLILEEPSYGNFDTKYLKSKYYKNTLPYEFIYTQFENELHQEILLKTEEYVRIVEKLFDQYLHFKIFSEEISLLKETYLSLKSLIRQILLNQLLCNKFKINALFGGMGNYKSAGLRNNFNVIEYEHGTHGVFNNSPLDYGKYKEYLYSNFNMEKFYVLINSTNEKIYTGQKKTYENNIFNLGLPEYRRYDFNKERILSLNIKYSLQGKKSILIATNSSLDYDLFYEFLELLRIENSQIKVLLRTHPGYEDLSRHKIDNNFIQLVNEEKLYDLFLLSDVIISLPSSVVSEASMFTNNVVVAFKENIENNQTEIEKNRYPFAHLGRLDKKDEFVSLITNLLEEKSEKLIGNSQNFVEKNIKELFFAIKKNQGRDKMKQKNIFDESFINIQLNDANLDLYFIRTAIKNALDKVLPNLFGRLVDLGCGIMPYKDYILSENKNIEEYIGIDIKNPIYQQEIKPDLFWDGKNIPLETNSVDCLIAIELFEHLPNLAGTLKEINRVLKPNGILFYTTPYLWPLHDVPNDQYRFTPYSINIMLIKTGFTNSRIYPTGGWNSSLAQMIGLWLKRSPGNIELKSEVNEFLYKFYEVLLKTDEKPKQFDSQTIFPSIYGIAFKASEADKYFCPICKQESDNFLPEGIIQRENAKCPNCYSLERHRLLYLLLEQKLNNINVPVNILHFAPEKIFELILRNTQNIHYTTCDIDGTKADYQSDIQDLVFEDNQFDGIICSHVLEHVYDDLKALNELFRVLKPGGWLIVLVPLSDKIETQDGRDINDQSTRMELFGHPDHLRIYGKDTNSRFTSSKFRCVDEITYRDLISEIDTEKYLINKYEKIFVLTKHTGQ